MAEPSVSVIIPLWNGAPTIAACLDALLMACHAHAGAVEILVVDNGSTDGAAEQVEQRYSELVRVIRNGRNLGFAGGCNVGIRAASGEHLLLLNQDTEVDPTWLAAISADLVKTSGIVGSLAFLPGGQFVQHAGGKIDWPLSVARHLGYAEPMHQRWSEISEPDFVTAAAMGIHRRVVEAIGLFDETFWPGYYEDADLCYRARAAGFSIRYQPAARLIHQEHASFRDRLLTTWARLRGRLRFCLKQRTPDFFLNEFLPAETRHRAAVLSGDIYAQIARAYLEAMPMIHELWQNRATPEQIREAIEGLSRLYAPDPQSAFVDNSVDKWEQGVDKVPVPGSLKPILTSSPAERLPMVGPAWQRLRRLIHRLITFYVERRESQWEEIVIRQRVEIAALRAQLHTWQKQSDDSG